MLTLNREKWDSSVISEDHKSFLKHSSFFSVLVYKITFGTKTGHTESKCFLRLTQNWAPWLGSGTVQLFCAFLCPSPKKSLTSSFCSWGRWYSRGSVTEICFGAGGGVSGGKGKRFKYSDFYIVVYLFSSFLFDLLFTWFHLCPAKAKQNQIGSSGQDANPRAWALGTNVLSSFHSLLSPLTIAGPRSLCCREEGQEADQSAFGTGCLRRLISRISSGQPQLGGSTRSHRPDWRGHTLASQRHSQPT